MRSWLESGGSDSSYTYQNSSDAAGHNPADDLRPYKIPGGYQFILQATHTTTGGYVDKIDFWFKPGPGANPTGSLVRAFSSSGIHGALGDNGQNYKSIAFLVEKRGAAAGTLPVVLKPVFGCGMTA